jgi:hypothetical protein
MKIHKVLLLTLIVTLVLSVSAEAGKGRGNSGNSRSQVASGPSRVSAPTFRSGSGARFNRGGTIAPSQRFSSIGTRSTSTAFRQHYINSSGRAAIGQRQFAPGTIRRGNGLAPVEHSQRLRTMQRDRFADSPNNRENQLGETQNHRSERLNQFENRRGDHTNSIGNRDLTPGRNHVFAQRSANWRRNWDRSCDHWWQGRRCRFINGSWFIFDLGFIPWFGFPYDYYALDYYPYQAGYDSGVYDGGDPNYYGQGGYDSSGADSTVAAAQERLARAGYYRGEIDGVFGPETRRAIMRYQSDNGLRVTGYLTTDTLQSLGLRRVASY